MTATLTLNPCVDRTVRLASLIPGGTNRVLSSRLDVGGKGLNVSRALQGLGRKTLCLGIGHGDGLVRGMLEREGLPFDLVASGGEARVNLKFFDESTRVMTECNERGAPLEEGAAAGITALVRRHLPEMDRLVLSGSVPPGLPEDIYRTLGEMAAKGGVPVLLDASGALLRLGIEARPLLIKPNLAELGEAFGLRPDSLDSAAAACRRIAGAGVGYVCLSMGADGALLATRDKAWFSEGTPIEARGVQGAGDALVAGFCMGLEDGLPPEELLRCAVACAHASLVLEGTQMCGAAGFREILPRIPVRKL